MKRAEEREGRALPIPDCARKEREGEKGIEEGE